VVSISSRGQQFKTRGLSFGSHRGYTSVADTVQLRLNVFDGTRRPIAGDLDLLITIRDGNQKQLFRDEFKGPSINFPVKFHNNLADRYTVLADANNYVGAGFFPVEVSKNHPNVLDLMLLPKHGEFDFTEASWANLEANHNSIFNMLSSGTTPDDAETRYEEFKQASPGSLAAFFNVTTAARDVNLPDGKALSYLKEMIWDEERMGEDRFFIYADARLVEQVEQAAAQGEFQSQPGLDINHPGATSSYKQKQFGEANIQFSFHENDKKDVAGVPCVKVELDMDYFKNLVAHLFLEVLPHRVSNGKTDPRQIYLLRWIAGRHAGVPEFDPPYTIGSLA